MMRRNLSEGSDESPRDVQQLEATERRLARRLQLLDELKARDLHECSWTGDARLVAAHLDDAARKGGLRARKDVKAARKKLRDTQQKSLDDLTRKLLSGGASLECAGAAPCGRRPSLVASSGRASCFDGCRGAAAGPGDLPPPSRCFFLCSMYICWYW